MFCLWWSDSSDEALSRQTGLTQLIMAPTTNQLNELLMGSVHLQQLEEGVKPDEQYGEKNGRVKVEWFHVLFNR